MSDLQVWPVPTLRELQKQYPEMVEILSWNKEGAATTFRPLAAGHAHLGNLMRMNALVARAKGEGFLPKPRGQWELAEKLKALRTPEPETVPQPAELGATAPAAPGVGAHTQVGVTPAHGAPGAAQGTSQNPGDWTVS